MKESDYQKPLNSGHVGQMFLVRKTVKVMYTQQTCLPLIRKPDGLANRKKVVVKN